MSDRNFNNHPYNDERFKPRRKGSTRNGRQRPSLNEMKDRVSRDIVTATRRRGHGGIYAHNIKDAINMLSRWLKGHSKKLIDAAFRNLVGNKVYRYNEDELRYDLMAA